MMRRGALLLPAALSLAPGLSACGNPTLTGAGLGAAGGLLYDQSQARY